jgi:Mn-containing catalase
MRVMNQYLFQAWGARGPKKYRDMLLHTGTEEIGHIEVLATAVAMNLDGMPSEKVDDVVTNPLVSARMGGVEPRHYLSGGLAAMPADANGVPFNANCIDVGGNLLANMRANVAAEAIRRTLAARLREMTDDPGMKDMLSFLIARDTMHQQKWLAAIEELVTRTAPRRAERRARRGRLQAVRVRVLRPRRRANGRRGALAVGALARRPRRVLLRRPRPAAGPGARADGRAGQRPRRR